MIHSQFNLNISVKDVYNDKPQGEGEFSPVFQQIESAFELETLNGDCDGS